MCRGPPLKEIHFLAMNVHKRTILPDVLIMKCMFNVMDLGYLKKKSSSVY